MLTIPLAIHGEIGGTLVYYPRVPHRFTGVGTGSHTITIRATDVAANVTTQHALHQALATIENCDIVLMLLNKAARTDVGTYYGYYGDEGTH